MSESTLCYSARLGRVAYPQALDLQMQVCELKRRGFEEDVLLLLEHPPTITLGRNGKWHNLLVSDEILRARGVSRFEVDRGGDITYHGPGQLVGYPLMQLRKGEQDVHRFMRRLEESLIRALAEYGIASERSDKYTGVWTAHGKIAAMGVHISRWITRHGFALNVNTDLSFYDLIVPCGIVGKQVAAMCSILRRPAEIDEVADRVERNFGEVFGRRMVRISAMELQEKLEAYARKITAS